MSSYEAVGTALGRVAVRSLTLPPATHTNVWVLGTRSLVLVDPGCADDSEVEALLQALPGEPAAIFLTHHHIDHMGGAKELVRLTGMPIWAHPRTAALLDFGVDRLVEDGEQLEVDGHSWTAVFTPGHAPGHLCLDNTAGTIIAGDMVAGVGTILLDPSEGDLGDYLASLDRLDARRPERLLPAHGPILSPAPAALARLIEHRHQRSQRIVEALATGPSTPAGLVAQVYADAGALVQAPMFRAIAARQILTHLRWLADRGAVGHGEADEGGPDRQWHSLASRSRP